MDGGGKEAQDRTMGYADTLKAEQRLNSQQGAEKEKAAIKIGKSAILRRLPRQ